MTIILSNNNYLFGVFTAIPWTSDNSNKSVEAAFLFNLTNPQGIPSNIYRIVPTEVGNAVRHYSTFDPIFGNGSDICL
ncbi:unnamed protein product, partial [Rotaria sp. Silwood2]